MNKKNAHKDFGPSRKQARKPFSGSRLPYRVFASLSGAFQASIPRALHRGIVRLVFAGILLLIIALPNTAALAHDGPHDGGPAGWHWDWRVLIPFGLAVGLYGRGLVEVWRRAGVDHGVQLHQAAAFFTGSVVLLVALVSPVDALGETQLTMHMIQHLLLMLAAAPLMAYGLTKAALAFSLPNPIRKEAVTRKPWRTGLHVAGRALTQPAVAWSLHAAAVILWHLPLLYQAAVDNDTIHAAQHLSFFLTGLLFWWVYFFGRMGFFAGGLYIFTTATYNGLIGAFLTLSGELAYPIYAGRANIWGLTALEDQQLAGVIMWVPPSAIYLAALLYTLYTGLRLRELNPPILAGTVSSGEENSLHSPKEGGSG